MYLHKWRLAMHEAEQNLVKHVNDSLAMILTRGSQVQEHLACFVPGMLMLGYGTLEREVPQSERERWRVLAQKLAMFCSESYAKSFTGLGAEAVDEFHRAVDDRNALRPEVAESIYYMKFFTGDEQWRARSWQIVLSLNKWSKRKYGYTSLKNISTSPSSDNKQESFFFAELLKYLYLAHTTPEEFDPTRMILTTEAHPLRPICKNTFFSTHRPGRRKDYVFSPLKNVARESKMSRDRDKSSTIDPDSRLIQEPLNASSRIATDASDIPGTKTLWVIPSFKRGWSLDLVLESLQSAGRILVSRDADSDYVDQILSKYKVDVIDHPWSCSRNPHQFPGDDESLNINYAGDTYGNPRSSWATCLKHHWWWMMNQAWLRRPDRVCIVEDDTVLHPQAFEWLSKQTGDVKLTPESILVPWCMSIREWKSIKPEFFCRHDDYNWDRTIGWIKHYAHGPNRLSMPSMPLAMHVGVCDGWDNSQARNLECTPEVISKLRRRIATWKSTTFKIHTIFTKWLRSRRPIGGWAHPRDWQHCLRVASDADQPTKQSYQHELFQNESELVGRNSDCKFCQISEVAAGIQLQRGKFPSGALTSKHKVFFRQH